jgi:hypothetical protein
MDRRRQRARRSQQRRYVWDYVYKFVESDGQTFDFGYNFLECATDKFFRARGAAEFTPYYCFLDYPKAQLDGLSLSRSMTLAEGHSLCDHRFREGEPLAQGWPPPFLEGARSPALALQPSLRRLKVLPAVSESRSPAPCWRVAEGSTPGDPGC